MEEEKRRRKGRKKVKKSSKSSVKRQYSAGGVVYRKVGETLEFLIIQPAGTDRWQLPKEHLGEGESSREAAEREVEEEGGVKVEVIEKLGNTRYFFVLKGQKIFKTVAFYLMEYKSETGKGPDHEVDEAKIVPFDEALEYLSFKDDREMVEKAKDKLSNQG